MTESDWGEDSWEVPAPPPPDDEQPAPAADGIPAGLDVAGAAAAAVDAAVKGAVRKEVAAIATKAVTDALTEELVEKLREQAQTSAAAAVEEQLSPAEPDPEPEPAADENEDVDEEKPPELVYGSVDEFVREYLRHVYRRATSDQRVWAARWWEYDEAVIRLEALWRAWEHLRLDPSTGMSVWWRDHADHHMAVLMDPEGPFAAANHYDEENEADKGAPLPYEAPREGLFPDVRKQNGGETASRPEPSAQPELPPPPPFEE